MMVRTGESDDFTTDADYVDLSADQSPNSEGLLEVVRDIDNEIEDVDKTRIREVLLGL